MKNLKITDLKKELLVLELTEGATPEITPSLLAINMANGDIKIFKGDYTLLGKPDEISEEDLDGIVSDFDAFQSIGEGTGFYDYKKAFNSVLEKHLFWVNPEPYPSPYDPRSKTGRFEHGEELEKAEKNYNEAQEKTFDKNRTLIFIKN